MCASLVSRYSLVALLLYSVKSRPFPGSSKGQSIHEHHGLKQTNFTIVHDSPSIRVGPDVVLFQKLTDHEQSAKSSVLKGHHLMSHTVATQQVFMLSLHLI